MEILSKRCEIFIVCILGAIFFTAVNGGAADEFVDIPMSAQFVPAFNTDGTSMYMSARSTENEIRKFSPQLKKFYYNREINKFIIPGIAIISVACSIP